MLAPALEIEKAVETSAAHGPSELRRIDYLDGWRGLAIVLVLQCHFFTCPGINTGRFGVDIFFVLSGFLMSRILFVKRVPLGIFYKRRISRIFPAFLVYVAVIYTAAWFRDLPEWHNILYTLTFLRSYFPANASLWVAHAPITHLWSLHVEEHCYIFLSIVTLIAVLRGREGPALILAGTAAIAIHIVYIYFPAVRPLDCDRTETAASHLLISAGYSLMRTRFVPFVRPWMPLAAAVAAAACYTSAACWWASIVLSPFLLAFAVNHLSETPRSFRSALASGPLRLLGLLSYSLYLWQQPFYSHHYFGHNGYVISFTAALAAGALSFYLVENPIRTWLNKRW